MESLPLPSKDYGKDFDEFIRQLSARREMEPEYFEGRRDRARSELLNPHDERPRA